MSISLSSNKSIRRLHKRLNTLINSSALKLAIAIILIILLFINIKLLSPAFFKINNVKIKTDSTISDKQVLKCIPDVKNQTFWSIKPTKTKNKLLSCLKNAQTVMVDKTFPNTINIKVTSYKFMMCSPIKKELCECVTSNTLKVKLPAPLCINYVQLPTANLQSQNATSQLIYYAIAFTRLTREKLPNTTITKYSFEKYKDATIIKIFFKDFDVLLNPNYDIDKTFQRFFQTYIGLHSAKENFKHINLLFDRVIIK